MTKRKVLLTGASGYVASQLRDAFRNRFDLRMTDVQARDRDVQSFSSDLHLCLCLVDSQHRALEA